MFFLLSVIIYSCKSKPSSIIASKTVSQSKQRTDSAGIDNPDDFDEPGTPVDYDHAKIIDTLYVTDRGGVDVKNKPDSDSKGVLERSMEEHGIPKNFLKLRFGHCLAVLEKKDGWLGVMERITRRSKEKGQMYLSEGWEEVYVQANKTGKITGVYLTPDDLRIIDSDDPSSSKKEYLKGHFDLKLINKAEYDAAKTTSINYLITDSAAIKKGKDEFQLPCENGLKSIKDDTLGEEGGTQYYYVGQIPFLNSYLITSENAATETGEYDFIDKKTGSYTTSFSAFPHISVDKKYTMGIMPDAEGESTFVELYRINGANIKQLFNVTFSYWMPPTDENTMFWGSNGCFYLPVAYYNLYGQKDAYFQYLKITIL